MARNVSVHNIFGSAITAFPIIRAGIGLPICPAAPSALDIKSLYPFNKDIPLFTLKLFLRNNVVLVRFCKQYRLYLDGVGDVMAAIISFCILNGLRVETNFSKDGSFNNRTLSRIEMIFGSRITISDVPPSSKYLSVDTSEPSA